MSFGSDRGAPDGCCDPVGDLGTAVEQVLDLDPVAMPGAALKTDLLRWFRRRNREDAGVAAWVLAAVRHQVGVEDGYVDTIGWLSWQTGKPRGELRRIVRLAEVCELLPATREAWGAGQVSTAAVEMIADARVKGFDDELVATESEFLDFARRGDHKSLRLVTQHFRACARADGSKTVREALATFTRAPAADDGTTLAQRQAEALVQICEVAIKRGTDASGARPVVSYMTQQRTHDDVTEPLTLGTFSGVIDPRDRERILCDSVLVPVTTDHLGEILDVGRATPVWNRAQRRAITHRSPHCQWPGCQVIAAWCDIHHVESWEHGGETSVTNGAHLCRRHHTFLHRHRDWQFTFDHQHFRVFRADGTEVHPDAWHRVAA